MTTIRKIEAMYIRHGKRDSEKCSSCKHLICNEWDRKYYKCELYGNSRSTATDWKKSNLACGAWNVDYPSNDGRAAIIREVVVDQPMEGQVCMEGFFRE